ncbi:membrane protein insertase YidC [Desulfovibrio mangrovi]|uniref:membrane protein insertase YidC n=1 Tax=Desulfovibrio mangrovi TaxID=2976983 RepID=UPI0022458ED7|nr:membrane protein insertase YidC [Desulfovibrio mangrovi]UZP69115.1 membrane protein insertase YidC [Desulfovibrio mangrovi]
MDNKRLLIAVALCLAVTVGWNFLAQHMGWLPEPVEQQQVAAAPEANSGNAQAQTALGVDQPAVPVFQPSEGREVTVSTPLYKAVLHSQGGVMKSFFLNDYKVSINAGSPAVDMVGGEASQLGALGIMLDGKRSWIDGQWSFAGDNLSLDGNASGLLVFTGEVDGIRVVREMHFFADTYVVKEKVRLLNSGDAPRSVRLDFTLGAGHLESADNRYNPTKIAWFSDSEGLDYEADLEELEKGFAKSLPLRWAGVESNYFLAAVAPEGTDVALKAKFQHGVYRVAIERDAIGLAPGAEFEVGTNYYLGPKLAKALENAPNMLGASIDFGMFSILAKPLLKMINFFHEYVGNYGVAIIILTILIKLLFWPLSHKSYKSMEQMKKLQPMMQKIREKYADDRERQNQEVMNLYKTYKVNPAGGCLPMLVQIPVFFGLYQALLNSIELRHASFITHLPFTDMIWLADLSASDPFYITPIVMGLTMLLQQMMTPSTGDPVQKKMMMFMPLVFTFMFLNFPAGLVVYWLVNNVLSIAQQWFMLRKA